MKKISISLIIFVLVVPFSLHSATQNQSVNTINSSIIATSSIGHYLGWRKIGLLPNSPFYFWKVVRERIKIAVTPDPVKKAELELSLLNKRLAELSELNKRRVKVQVLRRAFRNYEIAVERLKKRIESLKETSANPRIDELLEKLTELEIRHQEVLEKLLQSSATSTRPFLEKAQRHFRRALIPLPLRLESQEKYLQRLEKKIKKVPPLLNLENKRELHQLNLLKKLENALQQENILQYSTSTQDKARKLKKDLRQRIRRKIQILKKQGYSSSTLESLLKQDSRVRIPKIKRLPHTSPRLHRLPPGSPPNVKVPPVVKPSLFNQKNKIK